MHGGSAVAQAPFGPEVCLAGQAYKRLGDIQHLWPEEQVIIQIPRLGLIAAIGQVVIVDLVTQIQPATAQVVVKQPKAGLFSTGDGERNVLVQRVSAGGVVTHRIQIAHFKTAAAALQITGLLAQAIIALGGMATLIMGHAVTVRVKQIGAGGPIGCQRTPFTGGVTVFPFQPQRLMHGHAQRRGGQHQPILMLLQVVTRQAETSDAQPVAPFPGHVGLWRNAPGTIQRQLSAALDQHATQVVFQHVQAKQMAFIDQQFNTIGILSCQRPVF